MHYEFEYDRVHVYYLKGIWNMNNNSLKCLDAGGTYIWMDVQIHVCVMMFGAVWA